MFSGAVMATRLLVSSVFAHPSPKPRSPARGSTYQVFLFFPFGFLYFLPTAFPKCSLNPNYHDMLPFCSVDAFGILTICTNFKLRSSRDHLQIDHVSCIADETNTDRRMTTTEEGKTKHIHLNLKRARWVPSPFPL